MKSTPFRTIGRLVVLGDATNAHFRWLLFSWYADQPRREYAINVHGCSPPDKADVSFSAGAPGYFRIHCLRDECAWSIQKSDQSEDRGTLKRGEVSKAFRST